MSISAHHANGAIRPQNVSLRYAVKQVELAIRPALDSLLRPTGVGTIPYSALTVVERHDGLTASESQGLPDSTGTHIGRARVMVSTIELFEFEAGENLDTEATSPNWTPAFAILCVCVCVCDGGGSLTRAAIVSREYGIPCVVGTSVATLRIKTGDVIKVDGTKGVVTIVECAGASGEQGG